MQKKIEELVEGDIVAINKPLHMTSHDVVARVRRATGIKRVGHAGTLDPLATGVVIILVGREATKRQDELMGLPKTYETEITFGSISDTMDAEGPLHQTATIEELEVITRDSIEQVLPQFIGDIKQRPPAHSAIKVGGQPLYKKARKGEIKNEDIPPRIVHIDEMSLLNFVPLIPPFPPTARLKIHCQKGVYIRSLAHDIGQALSVGAYMSALTRTAIGNYTIDTAITIE